MSTPLTISQTPARLEVVPQTVALPLHEAHVGGYRRWTVRNHNGAVSLTAVAAQPTLPNPVLDQRGVAWQPGVVSVHRTDHRDDRYPHHECDVLPRCYGGPMYEPMAWNLLRQWERHGYDNDMLARNLTNIHRSVFGGAW